MQCSGPFQPWAFSFCTLILPLFYYSQLPLPPNTTTTTEDPIKARVLVRVLVLVQVTVVILLSSTKLRKQALTVLFNEKIANTNQITSKISTHQ